jgi:hypothetical protein
MFPQLARFTSSDCSCCGSWWALEVATCLPSQRVTRTLDRVIAMRGKLERDSNG